MGIVISYLRSVVAALRALLAEIVASNAAFKPVLERIRASPGLPVPNPTTPFWAQNPPFPALVNIGGNTRFFADEAEDGRVLDVVIIGSGMTGAGAAWGLLKGNAKGGSSAALCPMPRVLMLEARSICSGATGRNGGHIKGEPYDSFHNLRQKYGVDRAREILRFRRGHVNILAGLQEATLPEFEKAEIRKVETLDLFTEKETWEEAKERVELLRRVEEMDDIAGKVGVWEGEEMRKRFHLSEHIIGAVSFTAGTMWPYRYVTCILSHLLANHKDYFSIETNTPVNDITLQEKDTVTPFRIHTSKGIVKSRHVIHATNGYAAHLLPGLRAKLFPVRGQMTTQRAGDSFPFPKADSPNPQSWSIHHPNGALDYIIQRPVYWKKPIPQVPEVYSDYERRLYKIPPRPPPPAPERLAGELYVGGGLTHARHRGLDEIGVTNDDTLNLHIGAYLAGLLPFLFSSWGEDDAKGRVIRQWTGIMGFTVDLLPFVGRLGEWATGRKAPTGIRATTDGAAAVGLGAKAVTPGEWIAAGYNGEGMVHAWLCGVGVGMMVMGQEDTSYPAAPGLPDGKVSEWLPHEFLVTKERLEKRSIYDMATML